jgi:hypothetical protein
MRGDICVYRMVNGVETALKVDGYWPSWNGVFCLI